MDEKIYKIGNYEFETLREYRQAKDDLKKIKYITDELDIYDPEVALRLYNMMRSKKIKFKGEIGKSFFWCISDIVAENSENLMNKKYVQPEPEELKPMETNWQRIIGVVCIIIAVLSFGYYAITEYNDYHTAKELERLQKVSEVNMTNYVAPDTETEASETEKQIAEIETEVTPPPILEEYAALHERNSEMVGWLKIDGTEIDYPVMQSGTDQADYYLSHTFDKEEDLNGTLFIDARNDIITRDTNVIIYGHNMKSGMMFGSIKKYLDEDYWKEHQTIEFNTIYAKASYQVIAVCLSKVEYQDEEVFRYYNFLKADSASDFNEYLSNIQQLMVFDETIDATYGDELLTLSTCNSYTEDGRMFLVAKKI